MNKHTEILEKVKKHTGINSIVFTTSPGSLIIDDYSATKCLLEVSNMYNAPYVCHGNMENVGITCEDLEDLGILTPLFDVSKLKNYSPKEI